MNYLYDKQSHMERAKHNMSQESLESLRYACLELRMFIEAHVYERLLHDVDELPESVINTWQPHIAIRRLLEFDPLADQNLYLSLYSKSDETSANIEYNNLNIKELYKVYNSLGSYLHLPKPKDINGYEINKGKIKKIIEKLERLLIGNLMVMKLDYQTVNCPACKKAIIFTSHYIENNDSIRCQNNNCNVEFKLDIEGDQCTMTSEIEVPCRKCPSSIKMYHSKVVEGYKTKCTQCLTNYEFRLFMVESAEK